MKRGPVPDVCLMRRWSLRQQNGAMDNARRIAISLACLAAFAVACPAAAQSFPTRPVKIVVPVAVGGAPDVVARLLADRLAALWREPVVVENRPGAGERIGAQAVARAPGDGYTLLVTPPGPLVTSRFLYSDLPFDPAAFVPVSVLTTGHLVLLASQSAPFTTLEDVVRFAKEHPGKLTYASPGSGTLPHLTGEMFKAASGIETTHVPYKGLAPALADLLAGRVDIMFDNLGNSLRFIHQGRAKALAVVSAARIAELAGVPTVAETYPGVLSTSWFGMVASPGTAPAVAAHIAGSVRAVLGQADVVAKLHELAFTPVASTPAEMQAFVGEEVERWRKITASVHIERE
jgi:tripartite-type tricarboxylate transporter receptor subunit TctC